MTTSAQVTVRMYRQGLGDCLLLTFPTTHPMQPFHMLIDCGVVLGHQTDRDDRKCPSLLQVAEDIKKTTGGRIDLLVVTHEHWDHTSGFQVKDSASVFKSMEINALWLAWTENPGDMDAQKLKARFAETRASLRAAISQARPEAVAHISNVLDFFGAAGSGVTMEPVRALLKKGEPRYLDPKQLEVPLSLPDVPGVRIYVLGPPRDPERIKRVLPKSSEAYRTFLLAARADGRELSADEKELLNLGFPFQAELRISHQEAEGDPFFKTHYFSTANEEWRRIDDDWLGAGEELALALDSYTNNTSLVLAIELVKSGKVLVFAADAQVGNWESWGELTWTLKDGSAEKKIKIDDLLNRAVLYKVGHHGSINASLKQYVDLMTRSDLVALLPVDHVDALAKRWKEMPWIPLLNALSGQASEQSEGRVIIRLDESPTRKPNKINEADWQAFQSHFEENDLYMQYSVAD